MSVYNIYPKQFKNARIPIEKNRCFVLMPFAGKYDLIYGNIKQVLTENGYICNRADELFGSVPIMSNVLNEILKAHFIIADLTEQNANVFYELGVAHSFKDAQNIILIAQQLNDVPFDIRHLSTIIYNESNMRYLTASISKYIESNSHYYRFFESLQKADIISSINDDKDYFLNVLQEYLTEDIVAATDIIEGNLIGFTAEKLKWVMDAALGALYAIAATGAQNQLKNITRVVCTMVANSREFSYSYDVMRHFLYENKLEGYPLRRVDIIYLQCEMATTLAEKNAFFNDVIEWIITYFSRSKSASVDLNRYSLEKFLLTSKDQNVDAAIVNSIFDSNQYVREHMADLIGEKMILAGRDSLVTQLHSEENIYAMSSMITALGKLGDDSVYPHLRKWFEKRKNKILSTQHFFILKHLHVCLLRLKISDSFLSNFEKEYSEHLMPFSTF
jgi:hypothetical protein